MKHLCRLLVILGKMGVARFVKTVIASPKGEAISSSWLYKGLPRRYAPRNDGGLVLKIASNVVIFIIFLLLSSNAFAQSEVDTLSIFNSANSAYLNGDYVQAEEGYKKIIDAGVKSGEVYNNLGEAFFRDGRLGEAIFYLMNASKLDPRDADIKYNLEYAQERIVDRIEEAKSNIFFRPFKYIASQLSLKDSWYLLVIVSFLFWGLFIFYLFLKRDFLKWALIVSFFIYLLFALILIDKQFFDYDFGVVISSETNVYSGPGENNVLLFNLHEGTDFFLLSKKEANWLQIQIPNGKKGWISIEDVIKP